MGTRYMVEMQTTFQVALSQSASSLRFNPDDWNYPHINFFISPHMTSIISEVCFCQPFACKVFLSLSNFTCLSRGRQRSGSKPLLA